MIKACIFDLDGVVVDTAKYHYLAWKQLAADLGFDFSPEENERLKGVSRMTSLNILLEIGKINVNEEEKIKLAEKKNREYLKFITKMKPDEIFPGVKDFIKKLKDKGIKVALGSASKNAQTILKQLNIQNLFEEVVDGNMVTKAKPNPQIFLIGAELLNTNPVECMVFEDAVAGLEAAHNAGMKCVGVGDPNILNMADYNITGFENIKPEMFGL